MARELDDTQGRSLVTASTGFPCIDAFDSDCRAYQITLSPRHNLNAEDWAKFLDEYDQASCAEGIMNLYVLLPSRIYEKGINPMPLTGQGSKKNASQLKRRYTQWMLCLDNRLLLRSASRVIVAQIQV